MAKTGEQYTTARHYLLDLHRPSRVTTLPPLSPATNSGYCWRRSSLGTEVRGLLGLGQ
jgi:hypothetical protein